MSIALQWLTHLLLVEVTWLRRRSLTVALGVTAIAVAGILSLTEHMTPPPARDWNVSALSRIAALRSADFTFSVLGDSKDDERELSALLQSIGRDKDSAFTVTLGDMVARGTTNRYANLIHRIRETVPAPVVMCIGNHELSGEGEALYREVAGPLDYSFRVGNAAFMVLDDAEDNGPDARRLEWLARELEKYRTFDHRLVFLHCPPYDPRGPQYNHALHRDRADVLMTVLKAGRATGIFASHIHGYFTGEWDGIPYWITGGAGSRLAGKDPDHYFFHYLRASVHGPTLSVALVRPPVANATGAARLPYEADRLLRTWTHYKRPELALIAGILALLWAHVPPLLRRA